MAYNGVIPDGVYRIMSTMDYDINFDVAGGSGAIGANLQLWGNTDHITNTQVFWVECISANDPTLYSIRSYFTGFSLTCEGDQPTSNVCMYPLNTGAGQQWNLVQRGNRSFNGVSTPYFQIKSKLAPGLSLDACAAQDTPGTNVWLYNSTASATGWGQMWMFVPEDPYVRNIPVPSDLKLDYDGEIDTVIEYSGNRSFKPSWIGTAGSWQLRYRLRTRTVGQGDAARSAWTNWYSYDYRTDTERRWKNDGWGDGGVSNCATEKSNGRIRAAGAISRSMSNASAGVDLCDFEYEVRQTMAEYTLPFTDWYGASRTIPIRGGSAGAACRIAFEPTITVGQCAWTPLGLMVPVTSNLNREANKVSVAVWLANGKRVAYKHTEANQSPACTVIIPSEDLVRIPADGSRLKVGYNYTTADGANVKGEALNVLCSYDSGSSAPSGSVSFTEDGNAGTIAVSASQSYANHRCWVVTSEQTTEVAPDGTAHFTAYYPYGVPFEVFGISYNDLEGSWVSWHESYAARSPKGGGGYLFSFDGGTCLIRYGLDNPPEWSEQSEADYTAELTTMREFEAVRVGHSRSEAMSITGALMHDDGGSAYSDFQALKEARFAWLRDSFGHIWRVAVVGSTMKRSHKHYSEVTVNVRRVG